MCAPRPVDTSKVKPVPGLSTQVYCPICSQLAYHLYRTFSACACGVIFQDFANVDQSVYDQGYHQKYVSARCFAAYRKATDLYLPTITELTAGRRLLEIGSVVEATLRAFQERGWRVTGSDINRHARCDLPFVVGDFESVEVDGTFDCIWASHVFEHFRDPVAALQKVARLLSHDGVVFVAMPDAGQLDFSNPPSWGHLHEREHHILFSLARFIDVAAEVGLVPVRMRVNTGPEDGFICWTDYHTLLVRSDHSVATGDCEFPRLPVTPQPVELTLCEWEGQTYELLPFDFSNFDFWAREAHRRGIAVPSNGGSMDLRFRSMQREVFPFYRDPAASFSLTAAV